MSSVWSGHLHFGLVVMPVRLLVAARTKTTRFRRLYRKPMNEVPSTASFASFESDSEDDDSLFTDKVRMDSRSKPEEERNSAQHEYSAVRQVLQSEATGEEIRSHELVKGYEIAPNEYAAIDPQEIKAAAVETSDAIDVFHFVKATDVDPIYFERSYYVAPDSGAEKVYALLLEAMRKEECFGIARIGMHRREHMLILRPLEDCLVAHTMFYASEVRPAPHFESAREFSDKEVSMAMALIKGYAGEFDPTQFNDIYQERIHNIIDAQVKNRIATHSTFARQQMTTPPDLMEQIRLSLSEIQTKKSDTTSA